MTKHFTVGRWDISVSTNARASWGRPRFYRDTNHFVWGRFSIVLEDWTAEVHLVCAACGSVDVGEVSHGDEGWTVCQSCQAVEQGYRYVNKREWEEAT
jgi:hypothetical protein